MNRQRQAQIELHRALAKDYDRVRRELIGTRSLHDYWNEAIYEWLPKQKHLRILDNMCGTGDFLDFLSTKYSFVTGADISFDMISLTAKESRQRLKGLVCCDTEKLPFATASFDVVNVRGALHHINPISGALREMHRILRPGGMIILSEPCDDFVVVRKVRESLYKRLDYFDDDEKTFLSEELIVGLTNVGFSVHKTKRFGFIAYTLLGFPDIIPALEYVSSVPFAKHFSRVLIGIDKLLAKVPVIKNWSLIVFVAGKKLSTPTTASR